MTEVPSLPLVPICKTSADAYNVLQYPYPQKWSAYARFMVKGSAFAAMYRKEGVLTCGKESIRSVLVGCISALLFRKEALRWCSMPLSFGVLFEGIAHSDGPAVGE